MLAINAVFITGPSTVLLVEESYSIIDPMQKPTGLTTTLIAHMQLHTKSWSSVGKPKASISDQKPKAEI